MITGCGTTGRLSGCMALVTGAASGIGRAIVKRLRSEGASVALAELNTLAVHGGVSLQGNLKDKAYEAALLEWALEALAGLDILTNNTGVI